MGLVDVGWFNPSCPSRRDLERKEGALPIPTYLEDNASGWLHWFVVGLLHCGGRLEICAGHSLAWAGGGGCDTFFRAGGRSCLLPCLTTTTYHHPKPPACYYLWVVDRQGWVEWDY